MPRAKRSVGWRVNVALWSAAGFFAAGYFPTLYLGQPVLGFVLAVCGVIPFGGSAKTVRGGVLRGTGLGAAAAFGMIAALTFMRKQPLPEQTLAALGGGTVGFCAAVAGLFAHLSARRRRNIERKWTEES